jgi:NADH dehydrogenase
MSNDLPRVVIVGGGFAGLNVALGLGRCDVRVTLIDRRNFHLFQPLLYQVATGGLSPANIAAPLRSLLRRQRNTEVLLGEVRDIDVANRRLTLADGTIGYDTLVVATGSSHHYFGRPEWEQFAPGLKTIEDATEIRRRVLRAFELAERLDDPAAIESLLTFVVVGAGPTGVEMAGAISELARHTLRHDFRNINPARARVLLIEGTDRVLPPFRPALSEKADRSLRHLGVEVWTGAKVIDITPDAVWVLRDGAESTVPCRTVMWAAGVAASPLGRVIARGCGIEADRQGRVPVGSDLTVAGHPEIFVIGDLAAVSQAAPSQKASAPMNAPAVPATLPGVAPVAMQQGRYVANLIRRRVAGQSTPGPFVYRDKGSMATIGRASAVADLGWIGFSGYPAWLAWLFIHLIYLIQFQNRILVLHQWAWNYFTRNRSARLITNEPRIVAEKQDRPGSPPAG